jgi:hypothetical protein
MKYTLTFEIECGKTTCGIGGGKFCRFLHLTMNGKDFCFLFGNVFEDDNGWLARHPECVNRAKEIKTWP